MTGAIWKRPSSTLPRDLGDGVHLELDEAAREVRLVAPRLGRFEAEERGLGRRLREDERRRPEVPQPLEELEQLRAAVLELREDLERLEGVDHDEGHAGDVLLL